MFPFELTPKMREAVSPETWAEIAHGERLAMEVEQAKRALAVATIQAELDRKSTEHMSILGSVAVEERASDIEHGTNVRQELRRVLKAGLEKELNGPLPAAPPPCELHEAVKDFCDLRDDCQSLGLPFPSANTSADPEVVAAHLLKRSRLLTEQIVDDLGEIDPEYNFDDETKEVAADAQRRCRSISRVQIHNGFKDPTHHAYVRAALKRIKGD